MSEWSPFHMRARWPRWSGHEWFLTAAERGNDATALRPWTEGNAVRVRAHGREYFPALLAQLSSLSAGDRAFFVGWRVDPEELLDDDGPEVAEALAGAATRGAAVRGLVWRSHPSWIVGTLQRNRAAALRANAAGAQLLLDHRVRALGSHHQKFVVVRRHDEQRPQVAFVGGLDTARSRRDDAAHGGDPQPREFAHAYGPTPAWHDLQLEISGPAVHDVQAVFAERWNDRAPMTRLPWHRLPDRLANLPQRPDPLSDPLPEPAPSGTCSVQLLRTYPNRHPGYPFAPQGERSIARGYAKALLRARRLVYVEDQYLWSTHVAQVFADALRRAPQLEILAVAPRFPDQEGRLHVPPNLLGQAESWRVVREAGGDRVRLFDIENAEGRPIYVHSKVCVIDDAWAAVGSGNLNRRSWTHDSELTVAVLDDERDTRAPVDPGGLGDGARRFARDLRLMLMREHLDRESDDDSDLLDPASAVRAFRAHAAQLDAWYDGGCRGPRPPGRLRTHVPRQGTAWKRLLAAAPYALLFDPDGRPLSLRLRNTY